MTEALVNCSHCGRLMVPTLSVEGGKPVRSFCPFCATVYRDFVAEEQKDGPLRIAAEAAAGAVGGSILGAILGSFISF